MGGGKKAPSTVSNGYPSPTDQILSDQNAALPSFSTEGSGLAAAGEHNSPSQSEYQAFSHSYNFKVIPGIFHQSTPSEIGDEVQTAASFGLIDGRPDRWLRFKEMIRDLQLKAAPDTRYKVFFLGRHGEGFHNIAEEIYGSDAWNDYWSKLDGDGKITWSDALLTKLGEVQARRMREKWRKELAIGAPVPEKIYSSPLSRAAQTAQITFEFLPGPEGRWACPECVAGIQWQIRERIREHNGVHTCDRRRSATYIRKTFPRFELEPGFSEDDELWDPNYRETEEVLGYRIEQEMGTLIHQLWKGSDTTYISITAHGGAIRNILELINHPPAEIGTGDMIPVVVEITKSTKSRS